MRKTLAIGIALLGLVLLFAGCAGIGGAAGGGVRGNGVLADTEIPLDGSFDRIVSRGSFDVVISNEPSDSVLFQIDENLLSYVELDVHISGTTLYLSTEVRNISFSPTLFQFHVGAADLTAVSLTGSGHIRGEGVRYAPHFEATLTGSGDMFFELNIANDLTATVSGSGEIVLQGAATHANIAVSGSGEADLRALFAQSATATVNGSGEARVYAEESLSVTVTGSGDVFYYGNPQTKAERSPVRGVSEKARGPRNDPLRKFQFLSLACKGGM